MSDTVTIERPATRSRQRKPSMFEMAVQAICREYGDRHARVSRTIDDLPAKAGEYYENMVRLQGLYADMLVVAADHASGTPRIAPE